MTDDLQAKVDEIRQRAQSHRAMDRMDRTMYASGVIDAMLDDIDTLLASLDAANQLNEKLQRRVREQTAATQEAHSFVEKEIRSHLAGYVELGDNSCPIWQRVRSAVIGLKLELDAEREAVVAWLRKQANDSMRKAESLIGKSYVEHRTAGVTQHNDADAIARGEHREGRDA